MWKCLYFFLPFFLVSQEIEVRLNTRSTLKPLYLAPFGNEEMQSVLEFDLNAGGFVTVAMRKPELDQALFKGNFDQALWNREKIAYCLKAKLNEGQLILTVVNVEKSSSKTYSPIPLTRKAIHKLADQLHYDLFGKEGVASLQIIYTQRTKNHGDDGLDFLSEIWVSDSDGANAKQITRENSYCLCPSFLPHSANAFFYASERTGQSKIYHATLGKPKGELMVSLRGNQALPAISRDGRQIAFIADAAGRPDLFIQNLDQYGRVIGKARQIFTAPRATQASPTFSPDGKTIAFVSDKDGPPRIYVLDLTKRRGKVYPQLITKRNRENTSPAWSPDGKKLAYSAKVDGVRQIWVYDFETNEEKPLTEGAENKENPSWAPDSFHLVYNSENKDKCELFILHLNQGEPIKISKPNTQARFASWQQR